MAILDPELWAQGSNIRSYLKTELLLLADAAAQTLVRLLEDSNELPVISGFWPSRRELISLITRQNHSFCRGNTANEGRINQRWLPSDQEIAAWRAASSLGRI